MSGAVRCQDCGRRLDPRAKITAPTLIHQCLSGCTVCYACFDVHRLAERVLTVIGTVPMTTAQRKAVYPMVSRNLDAAVRAGG